ncbi:MAG: hypothetical protein J6Y02_06605 [Pseudobutyrivibrio sp.]|nr:hypothetical protein [Pseudobutyrivibrio sp.]
MPGSFDNIASLSGSTSIEGDGNVIGSYDDAVAMSGSLSLQILNTDYEKLDNLPTINGVLVKGDLTSKDLKIERGYDARVDQLDDEHLILTV